MISFSSLHVSMSVLLLFCSPSIVRVLLINAWFYLKKEESRNKPQIEMIYK